MKKFGEFLQEKHFEENPQILDDDLSEAFEHWVSCLDILEVLDYGDKWGEEIIKDIKNKIDCEIDCIKSGNALTVFEQDIALKVAKNIKERI